MRKVLEARYFWNALSLRIARNCYRARIAKLDAWLTMRSAKADRIYRSV